VLELDAADVWTAWQEVQAAAKEAGRLATLSNEDCIA